MTNFKDLCERATKRPWQNGMQLDDRTFHPNTVIEVSTDATICTVYGIPQNTRLEEIQHEEKWAEGLANARLLTIGANHVEELVKQLGYALKYWTEAHHGFCVNAEALLAQIEKEAAQ